MIADATFSADLSSGGELSPQMSKPEYAPRLEMRAPGSVLNIMLRVVSEAKADMVTIFYWAANRRRARRRTAAAESVEEKRMCNALCRREIKVRDGLLHP
jgi:hypothetical protein